MFGWRKKTDGFDWHAYVRTTIKVRREARRERIDGARQAALDKAHAAGHAVAAGGKAAGKAAVQGAQSGAVQGVKGLAWFGQNLARAFRVAFGPLGEWLMASTARVGGKLKIWDLAGPAALIGAIALASGLYRWSIAGLNSEAAIPVGIGLVLFALATPALLSRGGVALPSVPKIPAKIALACAGALVIGAGAYGWSRSGASPALPFIGSLSKIAIAPGPSVPPVEGRASVVAADTMRVNGTLFKLTGIDAPDKNQSCIKSDSKRWRCGEAAVGALEKLARSKMVRCAPSGSPDPSGRTAATCTVDGKDIGAELVRGGHVFSASTMFGGYASLEGEAKRAVAGIWNGEADRPAAYRNKAWEEAKKASPEGCPIKAVSSGNGKVYVVPWASDYKKTTVRTAKGERWFCSEAEAITAGYKAADRG